MMRIITFLTICLLGFGHLFSQDNDTSCDTTIVDDASTQFSIKQLIAPTSLIALGTIGAIDYSHGINREVANWFDDSSSHTHVDDYLRFAPSVAYLGLTCIPSIRAKHSVSDRLLVGVTSHAFMAVMSYGLKYSVHERRPDMTDSHSLPSGHVALAFTGAELLRSEYGIAWGLAGYGIATSVAVMRLYNHRHWLSDVLMGAGIGLLSVRLSYWVLPFERRLLGIHKNQTSQAIVAAMPGFDLEMHAATMSLFAVF